PHVAAASASFNTQLQACTLRRKRLGTSPTLPAERDACNPLPINCCAEVSRPFRGGSCYGAKFRDNGVNALPPRDKTHPVGWGHLEQLCLSNAFARGLSSASICYQAPLPLGHGKSLGGARPDNIFDWRGRRRPDHEASSICDDSAKAGRSRLSGLFPVVL